MTYEISEYLSHDYTADRIDLRESIVSIENDLDGPHISQANYVEILLQWIELEPLLSLDASQIICVITVLMKTLVNFTMNEYT